MIFLLIKFPICLQFWSSMNFINEEITESCQGIVVYN